MMKLGEKIVGWLIAATAVALLYFTAEIAIQAILAARKRPPAVNDADVDDPVRVSQAFMWRVFPVNSPQAWFEIRPQDSVDQNYARFEEFILGTWARDVPPPADWWDMAYEKITDMVEKARGIHDEMQVQEFRKSLENL